MNDVDRLEKKLLNDMGRAIADFELIAPGDKVMVAISGGKDSYTLLHLLRMMQERAPIDFSMLVVNLDQGHPGYPRAMLEEWLSKERYEYRILSHDTYSIVQEKTQAGQTQCALCSRLRRGILYNAAVEFGCNKIALGHHRDDLIHTLLLNMFFSGTMGSMPPKLASDDGRNTVIRPLAYAAEADIARYAQEVGFPIIPCNLCGSQENLKRQRVKALVDDLSKEIPNVRNSLLSSMTNLHTTHLLDRTVSRQGAPR